MKRVFNIPLLIAAALLLVSCDQFYFSSPQPVNARNIYEFPNTLRGSWTNNGDSIVVESTSFMSIEYGEKKIALTELKSSRRYKLKQGKVFVTDEEKGLSGKRGFPYVVKNDTVYYKEAEIFELCLGSDTFLRKAEDVYILNTAHTDSWYEIYLIDLTPGTAIVRYLDASDLEKINKLETLHVSENNYFLEARWTPKHITQLRQKGVFSDTLIVLRRKKN